MCLKLLMRKDVKNVFICFKISSPNQLCKGFASQLHTPAEQLFQGEENNVSHFIHVDVSVLLQ